MSKYQQSTLILISSLIFGCQQSPSNITSQTIPAPAIQPQQQSVIPTPQPSPTQVQAGIFEEALSKGIGAATIAQTSHSKEDWELVAAKWGEAIDLLKSVPKSSSSYALAQKKVVEYQTNLNYANKMILKPVPDVAPVKAVTAPIPPKPKISKPGIVIKKMAKPKLSPYQAYKVEEGKAKASVEKFMEDYFESTIDKGYDGTTSWCASKEIAASSLFSPVSSNILNISVYPKTGLASVRVTIESSTKGGSPIRNNWTFNLEKGDTSFEKQLLKEGSREPYKYSKSKLGGWCIATISK